NGTGGNGTGTGGNGKHAAAATAGATPRSTGDSTSAAGIDDHYGSDEN
ncbi:cell wall anchor protein, partial [Dietzia cercidiphylli]|nr:cell wall anchor protein [Dietzia cercidiphylli]